MNRIWFIGALAFFLSSACASGKIIQSKNEKLLVAHSEVLVHIVFLKTKPDLTEEASQALIDAVKAVEKIEAVQEFSMGSIADTQNSRFISDHDLVFQIQVKDLAAYQQYQAHSIHLKLKTVAKDKLAAPPAVYDYWKNPN